MNEIIEKPKIDESYRDKIPFIYDYQKGIGFFLSKREKLVADTWLVTRSYIACEKVCRERLFKGCDSWTLSRWLKRPHVVQYLVEKWREQGYTNGYTKERYIKELIEYKEGVKKGNGSTMFAMKLLGLALGFNDVQPVNLMSNVSIKVTQADGSV